MCHQCGRREFGSSCTLYCPLIATSMHRRLLDHRRISNNFTDWENFSCDRCNCYWNSSLFLILRLLLSREGKLEGAAWAGDRLFVNPTLRFYCTPVMLLSLTSLHPFVHVQLLPPCHVSRVGPALTRLACGSGRRSAGAWRGGCRTGACYNRAQAGGSCDARCSGTLQLRCCCG